MYRNWIQESGIRNPVPRRRGDVPSTRTGWPAAVICSPQTRGCTESQIKLIQKLALFPADAGMYRSKPAMPAWWPAVPRRRGDVPLLRNGGLTAERCSPQTRGCTGYRFVYDTWGRLFPADAGMYRISNL